MPAGILRAVHDRLVDQARQQDRGFAVVLHGGEPLLADFHDLEQFLHGLRGELPAGSYPFSIQTNGSRLSRAWLDLFADSCTSVSVSIDGPRYVNDIARVGHRGDSTFKETVRGIELLMAHPKRDFLFAGTLSVIQPSTSARGTYDFLKNLGSPSMDFLFQDGNHDRRPPGKSEFETLEYGTWLAQLLDVYLADPSPVPVRILDDTIKLCLQGAARKEGLGDSTFSILIIESNGDIRKNDTLRASHAGADVFRKAWNVTSDSLADVLASPEYRHSLDLQRPTSSMCQACKLLPVCGGGMPLYRWSSESEYNNASVYCRDHAYFIRHVLSRLREAGLQSHLRPDVR